RFGADQNVGGRTLILNGSPQVILGVLPERYDLKPRFSFGSTGARDIWYPAQFAAADRSWGGRSLQVLGRLAPGVTVESARQEASLLAARLRQEFPDRQEGWDVAIVTLKTEIVGDVSTTVLIVFGAVCFVLLIACANVANLLLTRAAERHQEMAVRAALGAARSRLFRQLVVESLLLALLGGGVGLVLAGWGIVALVALAPDLPRLGAIGLDGSVIGFSVIATLGTALIFGLAPAIHLAGGDLAAWLTQRSSAGRPHTHRIRGALVATQVALSFMLLVGAGLLVRSLINRLGVDVGFDPEHLFTAELQPRARQVLATRDGATVEERAAFFDQVVERVRAIPGVQAASAVSIVPLSDDGQATRFWALDRSLPDAGQFPVADVRWVHRDYHRTMGIRLVTGRVFDDRDRAGAPLGVIINETGARQLWPGEPAISKRIAMPWRDTLFAEIIGVVGDVRHAGPDDPVTRATLYWDHRQSNGPTKMVLVARTMDRPAVTAGAIRAAVRALDPDLPIYNARSMESLMGTVLARARFTTMALGSFALLALVLAALGLYGVMAYTTQQREREIGIRMALGADQTSVVRMVLRQGMTVVGVAVLIGAAGAAILSRVLRTLMFDVSPTDPSTFVGVALLLAATGLWACWLPARRASGIDPVEAIRRE
ncbi:MAG TPA: ABC transporter permease, partial [Gemmatimonadaceae bacterium]